MGTRWHSVGTALVLSYRGTDATTIHSFVGHGCDYRKRIASSPCSRYDYDIFVEFPALIVLCRDS
jgi:hypothetical protein